MPVASVTIAAWLVYGIARMNDAAQEMTAIPFARFDACERRMEKMLPELLASASAIGPERRPIRIKPYCMPIGLTPIPPTACGK